MPSIAWGQDDDTTLLLVEDVDHLFEGRNLIVDDIIGEQDGEGFVANEFARHENGVAESKSFFLANVAHVNHVRNGADDLEQVGLAALLKHFSSS